MRIENPPQAYLDRALSVERYLRPAVLATIYAAAAASWAVLLCLAFATLVHFAAANPTPITITIVLALALVPAAFAAAAWFLRPNDLLSTYISRYANMWREPIELVHDQALFKVMLMTGEVLGISVCFYYPMKEQKEEMKERLYSVTHSRLSAVGSMRNSAMSEQEIEAIIDPALEFIARGFELPVLYAEVGEVGKYREAYTIGQEEGDIPFLPFGTGTHG
jgi:hypothetical protein